ncbi:hypothetical protein DRH27_03740 [Candidatus Falkowbacteria bacterium]|nr:MAG: hypothetical protein DRH27_03740 [Candidatus Falkowbacteria bacterium]
MDMCNGTDLVRLHAVVDMDNPGRGAGRTHEQCHTVAGVLETTSEGGVICLVAKYDRVTDIMRQMVFKVFRDHDISFVKVINNNRFIFHLPYAKDKQVMFVVIEDAEEKMRGLNWPVVTFTEYKHPIKHSMYQVGEDGEV